MTKPNLELYVSVVTLDSDELRALADVATGGETLVTCIRYRGFPRWLLRLILGRDAMIMIDQINALIFKPEYANGIIKLLRDYDPVFRITDEP